jgi:bleomycin hydrolase
MDQELTKKLAAIAAKMKEKYQSFQFAEDQKLLTQAQAEELFKIREEGMGDIYKMVASHLGAPPEKFTFTFKDGTKKEFTPKQFAREVVKFNPKRNIVVSSDPTLEYDKPYRIPGSLLNLEMPKEPDSTNHFINVKNERLLELVKEAIDQDYAVWFGADANQSMIVWSKTNPKAAGIMHPDIYKTDQIYGLKDNDAFPNLDDSKKERVAGTTQMDHAMVFVGYDLNEIGKIVKLKVANSWGKKAGDHGYFHMYREWFEKYVSQIAIPEKILSKPEKEVLKQPKIDLPGS